MEGTLPHAHKTATFLTWLLLVSCSRAQPPVEVEPLQARSTRFSASILLADGQARTASAAPGCRPVVRALDPAVPGASPEVGLSITVSQSGTPAGVSDTDPSGVTAVTDRHSGPHIVVLSSAAGAERGRITVTLERRRTDLRGALRPDAEDFDRDGDTGEMVMIVDVLDDDDQDGASDTGHRALWIFAADGGVAFRHTPNGNSDRAVLDAQYQEISAESFIDLDGDFLPDDRDADRDGDGVLDSEEADSLPCPSFTHDPIFAAESKHRDFTCERCHRSSDPVPLTCHDCHSTLGREPSEVPAELPAGHFERRCELCHTAKNPWAEVPGANGEHHAAFPLEGRHLRSDCFACHVTGNRRPSKLCETCHLTDAALDHYQSDCQACHGATGWSPPLANHDRFPLVDKHNGLACNQCHQPPVYAGLTTACASCHQDDAPMKHVEPGFAARPCDECHDLTGFQSFRYPHNQWLLQNKHATVKCERCHLSPTGYTGNSQACETCHQTPAFPDHAAFTQSCEACHSDAGWVPASQGNFDHAIFPLTGSHATASCSSCHQNGQLAHPPQACSACHAQDRPARHVGRFDGECSECHQPTQFAELKTPWMHTATFALEGAHAAAACTRCHTTTYSVDKACLGCHLADRPPNHYGDTCETCHTSTDWNPTGETNHHSVDAAALPLTGGHASVLCSQCHTNGFGPIPRACESCHRNDTPLGHATAGCDTCHEAGLWTSPTRPPAGVIHPLRGGHVARTCVSCHGAYAGGRFATPAPNAACATCHNVPSGHIATGGSACSGCHSINGWVPATGGHQGAVPTSPFPYNTWSGRWFPVPHHGADQCSECHTRLSQSGYSFYSCTTGCHRNSADMNNKHNNGRDGGGDAFHLFHFDPLQANNPPNEGGATWPTGHVGCVNRACHSDGRG